MGSVREATLAMDEAADVLRCVRTSLAFRELLKTFFNRSINLEKFLEALSVATRNSELHAEVARLGMKATGRFAMLNGTPAMNGLAAMDSSASRLILRHSSSAASVQQGSHQMMHPTVWTLTNATRFDPATPKFAAQTCRLDLAASLVHQALKDITRREFSWLRFPIAPSNGNDVKTSTNAETERRVADPTQSASILKDLTSVLVCRASPDPTRPPVACQSQGFARTALRFATRTRFVVI